MKYTLCKVRQDPFEYSVWVPSKNAIVGEEVTVQTKSGWWKVIRLLSEPADEKVLEIVKPAPSKGRKTKKK